MPSTTLLPNTFVIGAPKCGTTALSTYLSTHPNIFLVSPKESNFWSSDIRQPDNFGLDSTEKYFALFAGASRQHTIRIDASTSYLWSSVAVPAILSAMPDARFVIMLRNPIDLAYACYMEETFWLHEDLPTFEEAWHACADRRAGLQIPSLCPDGQKLDYERIASVGTQLRNVQRLAPSGQYLVLFLDDLSADPLQTYRRTLSFLKLPDDGRLHFPRINPAKAVSSPVVSKLLLYPPWPLCRASKLARRLAWSLGVRGLRDTLYRRLNTVRERAPLTPEFANLLEERFREEIDLVSELTGRDLSLWLTTKPPVPGLHGVVQ